MASLTAPRALAPLRHRPFRLLTIGQLASNAGDACYAVALPWYVLAAHGGVLLLGTVLAAYGIPRTALITVGGYASDRWGPQNVMLATDIARALALAALTVTAVLGPARAVVLVPIAVVIGAGEGLFLPPSFSLAYLAEAACIAAVPFLGSTLAVGAAMAGLGVMNGYGNVLTITAFQRWAPPALMGRLAALLTLTSLGVFPVSVALAALVVRHFGPSPFFGFAAITLTVAIIAGLSQRAWRDFGSDQSTTTPVLPSAAADREGQAA